VIAILGATGYLGRSIGRLLAGEGHPLTLFARNPNRLSGDDWPVGVELRDLAAFNAAEFDLVINAIGAGDPARVGALGSDILDITAFWDQRVLDSMGPRTRYVFLSSGAVYGTQFDRPVDADSAISLPVNFMDRVPPYSMAKLQAEMRHRQARSRAILDLRIFGYADASLDLDGSFFLAELARAIRDRKVFVTSSEDMVRDYAGARELRALIGGWERAGAPNCPLDLYTMAPAGKHELLKLFERRYGLQIEYVPQAGSSPTGAKRFYASTYRAAAEFGFRPERDTAQVLTDTIDAILSLRSFA
jgi:nucleoside-diphosphate-sugar epimerase